MTGRVSALHVANLCLIRIPHCPWSLPGVILSTEPEPLSTAGCGPKAKSNHKIMIYGLINSMITSEVIVWFIYICHMSYAIYIKCFKVRYFA